MLAYMKFVFFSVSVNGENGLGDERADADNPPGIFGLEPPLKTTMLSLKTKILVLRARPWRRYHIPDSAYLTAQKISRCGL